MNTAIVGTFKYMGQDSGTIVAGGVKSKSGAVGVHRTLGPNSNSHLEASFGT